MQRRSPVAPGRDAPGGRSPLFFQTKQPDNHPPMPSILLSFVGQQDPVSDNTQEDGSIVSLMRHLVAAGQTVRQVVLLHTAGTQERAELTQGWLMDAPFHLPREAITLLPTNEGLSADPVNLLLAVAEARRGLEWAIAHRTAQDILELNASSGTPVMKSAWSILQAAGYVPQGRVWQVRNPKEMQPGQARVFQTNVNSLKNEFDLKVIHQQITDYNYSGALETLKLTNFYHDEAAALLRYAHCRFSLDFDGAYSAIAKLGDLGTSPVDPRWHQEIARLRQSKLDRRFLLREAYFNALIEYRNQQYADFLVKLSRFQEGVLTYLVSDRLGRKLPERYEECEAFWRFIQQFEQGRLQAFLQDYRFRGNSLNLQKFPNRPVLVAILEYDPQFAAVLKPIQDLSKACDRRNQVIHNFEGVSQIEDAEYLLQQMQQILKKIAPGSQENPFDDLNQQIRTLLDRAAKTVNPVEF